MIPESSLKHLRRHSKVLDTKINLLRFTKWNATARETCIKHVLRQKGCWLLASVSVMIESGKIFFNCYKCHRILHGIHVFKTRATDNLYITSYNYMIINYDYIIIYMCTIDWTAHSFLYWERNRSIIMVFSNFLSHVKTKTVGRTSQTLGII